MKTQCETADRVLDAAIFGCAIAAAFVLAGMTYVFLVAIAGT